MKNLILVVIALLALSSVNVFAACATSKHMQQIDIREINGKIQILNKDTTEKCQVLNNLSSDPDVGSSVKWVFHNLNCAPGECTVELDEKPKLSSKMFTCDLGTSDHRVCRLVVNALGRYCSKASRKHGDACEFNYVIKVRGEEVDPIIVVKPRPFGDN